MFRWLLALSAHPPVLSAGRPAHQPALLAVDLLGPVVTDQAPHPYSAPCAADIRRGRREDARAPARVTPLPLRMPYPAVPVDIQFDKFARVKRSEQRDIVKLAYEPQAGSGQSLDLALKNVAALGR
jgi:hypothetical protein